MFLHFRILGASYSEFNVLNVVSSPREINTSNLVDLGGMLPRQLRGRANWVIAE